MITKDKLSQITDDELEEIYMLVINEMLTRMEKFYESTEDIRNVFGIVDSEK